MLMKLLGALAVVVVGVLGYAATKPDSFRVERSEQINAPPEVVYEILIDFRQSAKWSPWEKHDPNMKKTFNGPVTGVGAEFAWEGNQEVGKGTQRIIVADRPERVMTELHFMEPFEGHNQAEFLIRKAGKGSEVTWAIFGPQPFFSKLMSVFMNMDEMIGQDFESGLAGLKRLAESRVTMTVGKR